MATPAVRINLSTGKLERTPDLVESSEAVTVPTAGGIPRAGSDGKISAGWIGGPLSLSVLPVAGDAEVSSAKVVRADDSRLGNPNVGGDLSGTALAAAVIKLRGRALSSAIPSGGNVLTWDAASASWLPAAPTTGASLRVIDGTTSVNNVTQISVASVTDNGGGAVTIASGGGSGSGKSAATRLFLFRNYR